MKHGIILTVALTILFAAADQLSKYFANLYISSPISLIDNWFILQKSHNKGMAFGIEMMPQLVLLFTTVILIFVIIHLVYKEINLKKLTSVFAVSLILGGAFGNLIDRLRLGGVTDFISFKYWPAFNLADLFIVMGVILGVVFYKKILKSKRTESAYFTD